jgi:VanZ family protein
MQHPARRPPWAWLAYLALLVYGSLYPWTGFRLPAPDAWAFLTAPFPAFVTRTDLLTNVLVYVPFGWLFARWLSGPRRLRVVLPLSMVVAALVSTLLEAGQLFVPGRIASNLDIATNSLGAGLGAFLFGLVRVSRWPGSGLLALRRRWLPPSRLAEAGVLLLLVWLITQLSLYPPSALAGRLRSGFVPAWQAWMEPERIEPFAALLYALELPVFGSLLSTLARHPHRAGRSVLLTLGLWLFCKFGAAALLVKWSVLGRLLSLELLIGAAAGSLTLLRLIEAWPKPSARAAATGFAVLLGLLLGFGAISSGLEISTPRFNVTGLATVTVLVWPWLAALYLGLWSLAAARPRKPQSR